MSTFPSRSATSLQPVQQQRSQGWQPNERLQETAPVSQPPRLDWPTLRAYLLAEWQPGEHWTLLGPTGTGKTHAALTLASLTPYTLVIATKRRDPLVEDLAGSHKVVTDLKRDVLWTTSGKPLHPNLIFWPQASDKMTSRQRAEWQAAEIRKALDWADRTGSWTVVIDELMWASRNLRLERELEMLYFQARTQGVSIIGCAQRPRQVPLLALNQATYLLIWQSSDKQDIERLRELSAGFPRQLIETCVQQLSRSEHEALFVNAKHQELARVVMPPQVPR